MKAEYSDAIVLSRNFNNRSVIETKKLYQTIQKAVSTVQTHGDSIEDDTEFLTKVYEPYIKKVTGKFYPYVDSKVEFADALQEAYAIFLMLIYKYDKSVSSFSYYINLMLPKHVYVWVQKINSQKYVAVDINSVEDTLYHLEIDDADRMYDYFNSKILEKEYIAFIENRSTKSNRSNTVREVCNKIFLGDTTCSDLAGQLNISYHAVYEIINKIKKELRFFFNDSRFSDFTITSTGYPVSKYKY